MSLPQDRAQQTRMEKIICSAIDEVGENKNAMVGMMGLQFISCDWDRKSLTLALDPAPWMANPMGIMHGGLIASAMDSAMGTLSYFYAGSGKRTPTVTMQTSYLRPVPLDHKIYIRARLSSAGRTLIHLTCELWADREDGRLCATSTGAYFCTEKPADSPHF